MSWDFDRAGWDVGPIEGEAVTLGQVADFLTHCAASGAGRTAMSMHVEPPYPTGPDQSSAAASLVVRIYPADGQEGPVVMTSGSLGIDPGLVVAEAMRRWVQATEGVG